MESNLFKIVRIDSYEVKTCTNQTKILHDFVKVKENLSLDECVKYFFTVFLADGECKRYRVLSMRKKKPIKLNVMVEYVLDKNIVHFYERC